MNRVPWRRLAPGLAVGLAAAFLLRRALFAGEALYWRDINMVWLPQIEVFVRTVGAGALPLWDAWTGFGRPLLADPRAEVFYPLTWLNLLLPPARFYTLFVAVHLGLGGLGVYRLARTLGAGRQAATLGGVAFAACGPLPALALTWHHMAGAAWMPWVLHAALRVALRGGAAARRGLAFVVAMQVFAGSPEYSALALLALLPVVVGAARSESAAVGPALLRVAAGVGLGLLLAAPQVLPSALWAAQAQRGALPREAAFVWSLHPLQLVELPAPLRLWGLPLVPEAQASVLGGREPWLHSIHLGAGLLVLALAGIGRRGAALAVVAGLALLAALGAHTPFLGLVLDLVPPLAAFRFPVKAMALFALATCTLAALGLERLAAVPGHDRRLAAASALALIALVVTAAVFPWSRLIADPALAAGARDLLVTPIVVCAAIVAGGMSRVGRRAARAGPSPALGPSGAPSRTDAPPPPNPRWPLLVVVAGLALLPPLWAQRDLFATTPVDFFSRRPEALRVLELGLYGRLYTQDQVVMPSPLAADDAVPRVGLRGELAGHGRLATAAVGLHLALNPPTAARWGVPGSFDRDILRFEPPFLARLNDLLREREAEPGAHARLLALGAVANAASLTPGPWADGLQLSARVPTPFVRPLFLWRVPGALPRVHVVTGVHSLPADAPPAALLAAGFDPFHAVALDQPERAAVGTARVETFGVAPDRLRATVVADAAAHVVFTDAWDPGWSARVDGVAAPVLRANGAFRAVAVGAGRHQVELRYWPPGLNAGLALALLGLLGMWGRGPARK